MKFKICILYQLNILMIIKEDFMKPFNKEYFEVLKISHVETNRACYALRSEIRLKRFLKDIPETAVVYAIRGADDNGEDATIEKGVVCNHNADLIMHPVLSKPVMDAIEEKGFIDIYYNWKRDEKSEYEIDFTGIFMTYEKFMEATEGTFNDEMVCPYCGKTFHPVDQKYSVKKEGEISDPTNLEDAVSKTEDEDDDEYELCGPYCPYCLGSMA